MVQTRSDAWTPAVGSSSGPLFNSRTDELPAMTMQAPAPMFFLVFASVAAHAAALPIEATPPPEPVPEIPPIAGVDGAADAVDEPARPPRHINRIELIIDSLPRHQLSQPIPIVMESLGDQVFTAAIPELNIATTGNTVGEALLFMKEQIETVYDDLGRRNDCSDEQQRMLGFLKNYIGRNNRKSGWFLR